MLDINLVKEQWEEISELLKNRGRSLKVQALIELDEKRRHKLSSVESLRHARKQASKKIGAAKAKGGDAAAETAKVNSINKELKQAEEEQRGLEDEFRNLLLTFPNIPHESVPKGENESANREERKWGEKPSFSFKPEPHDLIAEKLNIIDFKRAAKITGSRFSTYVGAGAKLERALINFMLDIQTLENGYLEMLPPCIINSNSLTGTGQLPKFEADLFKLNYKDYYLLPTAEVALTNHYAGEILPSDMLPIKLAAFTPCFRSEAGSYGKDVKGLIRQHQFNKVEIVKLTHPDNSWDELESLTQDAEKILQRLGLHYRVVTLSRGDMGFSAAKTYDIEVWLPSQDQYREISSCSNCTDFQARRAGIRFKDPDTGKNRLVHTLNGSGLAVGRTVVALLENNQQEDGSVLIPEPLRKYMNSIERITKS